MTPEKKEIIRARAYTIVLVIYSIVGVIMLTFGFYQKFLRTQSADVFAQQSLENSRQLEITLKELEICRQK